MAASSAPRVSTSFLVGLGAGESLVGAAELPVNSAPRARVFAILLPCAVLLVRYALYTPGKADDERDFGVKSRAAALQFPGDGGQGVLSRLAPEQGEIVRSQLGSSLGV